MSYVYVPGQGHEIDTQLPLSENRTLDMRRVHYKLQTITNYTDTTRIAMCD